jgi:putative ABC transport system permease protein
MMTPVSGSGWNEDAWADGTTMAHKDTLFNSVGAGYFRTMGTRMIGGRDFDDHDDLKGPKVAIVNQQFAKEFFGGRSPVGERFRVEDAPGKPDRIYQIVGLVSNTKYYEMREDDRVIAFLPATQERSPDPGVNFVIRTNGPVGELFRNATAAMAEVNPAFSVNFTVLSTQLKESLMRDRLMAALAGAFGVLAGGLAVLGLYGVIAYMVARRRNEIGVRIALGASRGGVIRLVLREAAVLLTAGLVVGTGLSLWAGRAAASLLYGVKPTDPAALGGAVALLAVVALAASYTPAWKASRLQPMDALRDE